MRKDVPYLIAVVVLAVAGLGAKGCASYIVYRRDVEIACLEKGGTIIEAGDNHLRCVKQVPVDSVKVQWGAK